MDESLLVSETQHYRHLTVKYCQGNGLDIASGGDPVVPTAIQVELPEAEYERYNSGQAPGHPIEWRGTCFDLPFKNDVLDYVYSSHLIEDFSRDKWRELFDEWRRVLKPGGYLIIIVPEVSRWNRAVADGQPPNGSHSVPEPSVGDMSRISMEIGLEIVSEKLTECHPHDYSILGIFRK